MFCQFQTWFLQATQAVKIKFELDIKKLKNQVEKSISWNRDLKESSTNS